MERQMKMGKKGVGEDGVFVSVGVKSHYLQLWWLLVDLSRNSWAYSKTSVCGVTGQFLTPPSESLDVCHARGRAWSLHLGRDNLVSLLRDSAQGRWHLWVYFHVFALLWGSRWECMWRGLLNYHGSQKGDMGFFPWSYNTRDGEGETLSTSQSVYHSCLLLLG